MYSEEVHLKKKVKKVNQEKEKKEEKTKKKIEVHLPKFTAPSNFKEILKKMGILLFVFFAFIFFTTKMRMNSESKVFDENLNQIKNAAYKYYKENNRPTEKKEEYSITLQDLIDENYVKTIQDKKGKACDGDSEVSIKNESETKYDLLVHLNCNNTEMEKNYTLTYKKEENSSNSRIVYYKLEKEVVTNNYEYSCPTGYTLNGKTCSPTTSTLTETPIAKYKTITKKVTKASFKKGTDDYEYVEPIKTTTLNQYTCTNKNETLIGDQCVSEKDYTTTYSCPSFYPKKKGDKCYYVDNATEVWSNWTLLAEQTFSTKKTDTKTKSYELVRTIEENNKTKYVYRYYTRVKNYECPTSIHEDIEQKSSKCYHYIDAIPSKTCPSGYSLNENGTKCVKSVMAKKLSDTAQYVCPTGYTKKGSGANMSCYRKTENEGYYYCKNTDYRLEGDQCIRDASTELIGYKCPTGYTLNGSQCTKTISGKKISATKTNNPEKQVTYKWSEKVNEKGWTWTGETKEI